MKRRITIDYLEGGQPRPYADSVHRVKVSFEITPWNKPKGEFLEPDYMSEERARIALTYLGVGFTGRTRKEAGFLESYLEYLKPIDTKACSEVIPQGDPKQRVASIWEFNIVHPYTD